MKFAEIMTTKRVLEEYGNGRRDFSRVKVQMADFTDKDIRGIVFRDAEVSHAYFQRANLEGADFTDANVEWCDFSRAIVKNATFARAKMGYSLFTDVIFENTNLSNADVQSSLLFNADISRANITGANFYNCVFRASDLTQEGISIARQKFMESGSGLPYEVKMMIEFSLKRVQDKFNVMQMVQEETPRGSAYSLSVGKGYSVKIANDEGGAAYESQNPYRSEVKYKARNAYRPVGF